MSTIDCTGVVLAGGTSRRFEPGNKALATIDGVPFVRRIVDRLATVVAGSVVVAVRTPEQADEVGSVFDGHETSPTLVRDADQREGPLAGVSAVLDHVGTGRFALVACDMPLFDPAIIQWLAARERGADAVVPVAGEPQPMQALYRTERVEEALDAVSRSGRLFALLAQLDSVRYVSDAPPALPLDRSLANVNTVADLRAVRDAIDSNRFESP